ncbi:hypothetical protein PsorP6_011660 [Peronosclerospora sorghi]|uniref:Uncharacterized protein n=1 Tax=Peronosclerospora sorghi TaxID=230839 RepID=A0ACC0WL03_9STRA|nr:hypothetical protein PsorP6_011660 [Peronosclerospora sorghi]
MWPCPSAFVEAFVDYGLFGTPVYAQSMMLKRLYRELTKLVERVCPLRPTQAVPAFAVILTTFGAHLRYYLRRVYTIDDKMASVIAVFNQRKSASNVKLFMDRHSELFKVLHKRVF